MEVEASLEPSLLFSGDSFSARTIFRPKNPIHILSAAVFVQSSLHLGDLLQPEPFEPLRSRGIIHGSEQQRPQGIWGILGLTKQLDYKLWNSPQQLLCTDLKLAATDPREFEIALELPRNLPPSHSSKPLELHHELVVELQYLNGSSPTRRLLALPFKVYPLESKYNLLEDILVPPAQPSGPHRILQNLGTLVCPRTEHTPAVSAPQEIAQPKINFNLVRENTKIASINLARPSVPAGDLLTGSLTLGPECYHMSAQLERVETIKTEVAAANEMHRKVISSQSCTVYGLDTATFQLTTPASLFPQTDLTQIKVEYVLRVELTCLQEAAFEGDLAKPQVKTSTISTTIPITVAAPSRAPLQHRRTWSIPAAGEA